MNKSILTLSAIILMLPGLSLAASVYKWTDENGVTHFGDRKPTGKQTESLDIRTGKPGQSDSARPTPQERARELEHRDAAAKRQEKANAVEAARQKQRDANCSTARTNLDMLQNSDRVRIEENGEQRYLSPEEIAQKITEFEEIADKNCAPEE